MLKELWPVLILALVVFPGVPGDRIYRKVVGVDWREKEWQSVLRLISFSLGGLIIYVIADWRGSYPPIYLFPESFKDGSITPATLRHAVIPYVGHLVGAGFVGFVAALFAKLTAHWVSVYPSAWDHFIRTSVPKHLVIVSLTNRDAYAGIIKNVDLSVPQSERDIVLGEPALYDESANDYIALAYSSLFLPASLISSIAVVHDSNLDKHRLSEVGHSIFKEEKSDE